MCEIIQIEGEGGVGRGIYLLSAFCCGDVICLSNTDLIKSVPPSPSPGMDFTVRGKNPKQQKMQYSAKEERNRGRHIGFGSHPSSIHHKKVSEAIAPGRDLNEAFEFFLSSQS